MAAASSSAVSLPGAGRILSRSLFLRSRGAAVETGPVRQPRVRATPHCLAVIDDISSAEFATASLAAQTLSAPTFAPQRALLPGRWLPEGDAASARPREMRASSSSATATATSTSTSTAATSTGASSPANNVTTSQPGLDKRSGGSRELGTKRPIASNLNLKLNVNANGKTDLNSNSMHFSSSANAQPQQQHQHQQQQQRHSAAADGNSSAPLSLASLLRPSAAPQAPKAPHPPQPFLQEDAPMLVASFRPSQTAAASAATVTATPSTPSAKATYYSTAATSRSHSGYTGFGADAYHAVPRDEYRHRQATLAAMVPPNSLIVIPAAAVSYMANDIPHRFRQDSDFQYLCGFPESDAVLLLATHGREAPPHATLLVLPRDPHREMWDGPRVGPEQALQHFPVDETRVLESLASTLKERAAKSNMIFADHSPNHLGKLRMTGLLRSLSQNASPVGSFLSRMRVRKSAAELDVMRKACQISSVGVVAAMKATQPGILENELDAEAEYRCRRLGASFLAYPPVVAGGPRANTIHYVVNNNRLKANELVLMDAGCEYLGYSGDITRTWPVSGTFSDAQRDVYEAVLAIQTRCIDATRVDGTTTLYAVQCVALEAAAEQLRRLGLPGMRTPQDALAFFPHSIGHYLGMDVHDSHNSSGHIPLENGMVITIEPGLYFQNDPAIPQRFRGIGVRIEDDIALVDGGAEVLTHDCPKTVRDIEAVMRERQSPSAQ